MQERSLLLVLAKQYDIGLNIDAEETDRRNPAQPGVPTEGLDVAEQEVQADAPGHGAQGQVVARQFEGHRAEHDGHRSGEQQAQHQREVEAGHGEARHIEHRHEEHHHQLAAHIGCEGAVDEVHLLADVRRVGERQQQALATALPVPC